eukprot:9498809-Pyramimonas_sp.AAC.1
MHADGADPLDAMDQWRITSLPSCSRCISLQSMAQRTGSETLPGAPPPAGSGAGHPMRFLWHRQ